MPQKIGGDLCAITKRCNMDEDDDEEVCYIQSLGYEVEIRRRNKTVSKGHGKTKIDALVNAIENLKEK
jgi:hypothetical protein